MFNTARSALCLAAAIALWLAAASANAAVPGGETADLGSPDDSQVTTQQSNGPTLSQAVEQVRRQYGGRIISAETRRSGGREVHHIKVLTKDNKVRTVKVNGRRL